MSEKTKILKKLKEGGQKKVFLVEHEKQKKILKLGSFYTKASLDRIIREVDILRSIDSEFFPKNYDFTYDLKSKSFEILEEYIEGPTLNDVKHHFKTEKSIAKIILDIINGMQLLWKQDIVHRDLKPDNIIISIKKKHPVIIDLGIARCLVEDDLTKTISPMGPCTIPYASPEQLLNKKDLISPRSDFFSIGIIAMEMYYGYNPFDPDWVGSGDDIRSNILSGNKKIVSKGTKDSEEFIAIFAKTLEREAYNRYRKYEILKEKLESFIGGE